MDRTADEQDGTIAIEVETCQNCGCEHARGEAECPRCRAPATGEPSTAEYCGADGKDGEMP